MNSSIQNQKFNLTFFFGAVSLSMILSLGAGYFVYTGMKSTPEGVSKANQVCVEQLRFHGYSPKVTTSNVEVSLPRTVQLEELVSKASVILAGCVGYEIKEFCAGTACRVPGLSFKLGERSQTAAAKPASSAATAPAKPAPGKPGPATPAKPK